MISLAKRKKYLYHPTNDLSVIKRRKKERRKKKKKKKKKKEGKKRNYNLTRVFPSLKSSASSEDQVDSPRNRHGNRKCPGFRACDGGTSGSRWHPDCTGNISSGRSAALADKRPTRNPERPNSPP
jgi:hypothetical protein